MMEYCILFRLLHLQDITRGAMLLPSPPYILSGSTTISPSFVMVAGLRGVQFREKTGVNIKSPVFCA